MMSISLENIDILIPCHPNDSDTLELCIKGIKDHIENPINKIFIVSQNDDNIIDICNKYDCVHINEIDYIGFSPDDMRKIRLDKRGWLYQQLIKLNGKPGLLDNYLVIDADVMLVKPYKFIENNIPIFNARFYPILPSYIDTNKKLTGKTPSFEYSRVTDKMLFNDNIIREIHQTIEDYTGINWIEAIIDNFNNDVECGFSEFELYTLIYGDRPHNNSYRFEQYYNRKHLESYERCQKKFRKRDCITFTQC